MRKVSYQSGIINNVDSPHVILKNINIGDCKWTEGFWADKCQLCEKVMMPHMGTLLKGDIGHAYNNFKIAAGLKEGQAKGMWWDDGDFYKWMEAAMYVYANNKDENIFEILLRIPDWAEGTKILVNGKNSAVDANPETFLKIIRLWKAGDVMTLEMPMEITLIEGHQRIEEVRNQAAIKRGLIVYCIETPDLPENTGILDVYLPVNSQLNANYQPELLGRVTTISGKVALSREKRAGLYHLLKKPVWQLINTQFVPYYSWCN